MAARTIVVTGGGTGIGLAVARAFAADGDSVVITGRRRERLARAVASGGRIVTIGSIAARRGAGSYGAAKAAIEAWNAWLATEVGPRAVTANVVSPGLTAGTEFFRGLLGEDRRQRLIDETRTGREGSTDDVAAAVRYLASPQAGHVTGQVLHVDGGAYLGH